MPDELSSVIQNIESSIGMMNQAGEGISESFKSENLKKFQRALLESSEWIGRTAKQKESYVKQLIGEHKTLKKILPSQKELIIGMGTYSEELKKQGARIEQISSLMENFMGGFSTAIRDADGGIKQIGKTTEQGLLKLTDKLPGMWGKIASTGIKAISALFKHINQLSEYYTELRRGMLQSARVIRDKIDTEKEAKEVTEAQYRMQLVLGRKAKETTKAIEFMTESGFKASENEAYHVAVAYETLSKGLALSDGSIRKFSGYLTKEFKMGSTAAMVSVLKMSDVLKTYTITEEEAATATFEFLQKGKDFGLTLGVIKDEMKKAEDAGLTYAQTMRQAGDLLMRPSQMGMEKQVFLAQRLGLKGDIWEQSAQIQYLSTMEGSKTTRGQQMMEVTAKEAGIDVKRAKELSMKKEELTREETIELGAMSKRMQKFGEIFSIPKEVSESWIMGGKMAQRQAESLKGTEEELKATEKQLFKFLEETRGATTGLEKFKYAIKATISDLGLFRFQGFEIKKEAREKKRQHEAETKHGGGIMGYFDTGGTSPFEGYAKVLRDEMILNTNQQSELFNMFRGGGAGGGGDVNVNIQGVMLDGLQTVLREAILKFFDEAQMGVV